MKKIFIFVLPVLMILTTAISKASDAKSRVLVVSTADRIGGINALLTEYKLPDLKGKK